MAGVVITIEETTQGISRSNSHNGTGQKIFGPTGAWTISGGRKVLVVRLGLRGNHAVLRGRAGRKLGQETLVKSVDGGLRDSLTHRNDDPIPMKRSYNFRGDTGYGRESVILMHRVGVGDGIVVEDCLTPRRDEVQKLRDMVHEVSFRVN